MTVPANLLADSKSIAVEPIIIQDKTGNTVGLYKESHALLIGVSDYTRGWPDLPSIPDELDRVESALTQLGFQITRVKDPTTKELKHAFDSFIDQHGFDPDNRLLIFFSGHGYTRPNKSQRVHRSSRCPRSTF